MRFSIKKSLKAVSVAALLAMTSHANAGLIKSLDGNLIYDDVSDITWLADMKFAKNLEPLDLSYDADNKKTWQASMDWAADLDVFGSDAWRLATLVEGLALQSSNADFGLIDNIIGLNTVIWSSSVVSDDTSKGHLFKLNGASAGQPKTNKRWLWAVVSGDFANIQVDADVPEPASTAIFALGLAGLAYRRKQLKIKK